MTNLPPEQTLPLPRLALESMPFPMNIYTPDGYIVVANAGVEKLFRQTPSGYNVYEDPVTEENGFRAAFDRARSGEPATLPPIPFDPAWIGFQGEVIWFTTYVFPFRSEDGVIRFIGGVYQDVTAQVRAEAERVQMQEQMFASQQAAIRELSTPLIPLADNIVVMPLVGTIDTGRAEEIMQALLEGIASHQAEAVLLDISGVQVVDTQVADALLRSARAVQLLGAQVILTGISAEIAQTIVHLGADMSQIVTQANLQTGLRYAMERYGRRL